MAPTKLLSQRERDKRVVNIVCWVFFIIGCVGIVIAAIVTSILETNEGEEEATDFTSLWIELILFIISDIFLIPLIVEKTRDHNRRKRDSERLMAKGNFNVVEKKEPERPQPGSRPSPAHDYYNYDENGNERAQSGWDGESKDEHEVFEDIVEDAELFDELDDDG